MTRDERLGRLEQRVDQLIDLQNRLVENLTEMQVRQRFCMQAMRMAVPQSIRPALLDANGKASMPELTDGWTAYVRYGGREATVKILEAEFRAHLLELQASDRQVQGDTRDYQDILRELNEISPEEAGGDHNGDHHASGGEADRDDGRQSRSAGDPQPADAPATGPAAEAGRGPGGLALVGHPRSPSRAIVN